MLKGVFVRLVCSVELIADGIGNLLGKWKVILVYQSAFSFSDLFDFFML